MFMSGNNHMQSEQDISDLLDCIIIGKNAPCHAISSFAFKLHLT